MKGTARDVERAERAVEVNEGCRQGLALDLGGWAVGDQCIPKLSVAFYYGPFQSRAVASWSAPVL